MDLALNKLQRLICHKTQTNKLTTWFLFKIIFLESNALSQPFLSCFCALLEGFYWDTSQLHCYRPLDGLHTLKMGLLDDSHELGEKKTLKEQVNTEVVPEWQCTSCSQPGRCSAHPISLIFILTQIFSDNLPNNTVSIHVHLTCDHPNNHQTTPALPAHHWPQSCLLKVSHSSSYLSPPHSSLWISSASKKYMCMTVSLPYTCSKVFKALIMKFPPTRPNISGFFILQCS